jgi:hypothetical protein
MEGGIGEIFEDGPYCPGICLEGLMNITNHPGIARPRTGNSEVRVSYFTWVPGYPDIFCGISYFLQANAGVIHYHLLPNSTLPTIHVYISISLDVM